MSLVGRTRQRSACQKLEVIHAATSGWAENGPALRPHARHASNFQHALDVGVEGLLLVSIIARVAMQDLNWPAWGLREIIEFDALANLGKEADSQDTSMQ
jgi:hypothetical protein